MEKAEPFFIRDGDHFVPQPIARGPWDEKSLHGRVIIGLLGHEIERRHGDPGMLPARLTVDMYRLPDLSPVEVTTRIVRDGHRIKVIDAEFISGGTSMGRATCQLLRRTENAEGNVWSPPGWEVPAPETLDPPPQRREGWKPMWDTRPITGSGFGGPAMQKRAWLSEIRELVGGDPLTPFTRVAVASDFASPFANGSDKGLGYINTDVTVYLHRAMEGEWLGFETVNHHATEGVAVGECFLYDRRGPIGSAAVAALAQRRKL